MTENIGLDRLTGIIAFARAASLGSYTAAARALGVSPSAVSKSVQRLEERLKLKLFSRTTRSLSLTSEGRDLYERAVRLLKDAEEIEQAAVAARTEPVGVLKVTASLPVGVHILAPALPRFREQYPKVAIDLRLGDHYVDLVEEGVDLAIRVGHLADSRLISRQLAPHRIGLFASPDYIARRGMPQHPAELEMHECVNFRYQSTGQSLRWSFRATQGVTEFIPGPGITADVSDAVAAVIMAGGGIGMSPTYLSSNYVKRGLLVQVLPEHFYDRSSITALWPESRRDNPNVRAFLNFLFELVPSPPPWDRYLAEVRRADSSTQGAV